MIPWGRYNHFTHCYETGDGTSVAAELADNASCLADFLHIAAIRERQRAAHIHPYPPARHSANPTAENAPCPSR